MRVAVLVVAAAICLVPQRSEAQRQISMLVAAGVTAVQPGERTLLGWYFDAAKSLVPSTAIVGEVGASYHPEAAPYGGERQVVALGGLRLHFVRRPRAWAFGQFLVGRGFYRQEFTSFGRFENSQSGGAVQLGLGVGLPVNARWAVQVRADARAVGVGDGILGGRIFSVGIGRMWGRP